MGGPHDLGRRFRPEGHRLGIAVASAAATPLLPELERLLESHDLRPQRRLARLHPRVGEDTLRADDVVDFLERYGHEYALFVIPADMPEASVLADAAARAGCEVVVDGADA